MTKIGRERNEKGAKVEIKTLPAYYTVIVGNRWGLGKNIVGGFIIQDTRKEESERRLDRESLRMAIGAGEEEGGKSLRGTVGEMRGDHTPNKSSRPVSRGFCLVLRSLYICAFPACPVGTCEQLPLVDLPTGVRASLV